MNISRTIGACAIVTTLWFTAVASLQSQEAPQRVPSQLFQLGGINPSPEVAFTRAPELLVDRTGRLYVRVPGEAEVRVFDQQGDYLRSIGGSGEGPGEFEVVGGFGIVADTLWLRNWPTPRISLFTFAGEHIRTVRSDVSYGRPFSSPQSVRGLLVGGRAYATPLGNPLGVEERIEVPVLVGDRLMKDVDTIFLRPAPYGMYVPQVGSWSYAPFTRSPLFEPFPDGAGLLMISWSDTEPGVVHLTKFDASGSQTLRRELRFQTEEIPDVVRREVIAEGVEKAAGPVEAARRRGASVSNDLENLVRDALDLPQYYPPVRGVVAGVDGSIWVQRRSGTDGQLWVVLDSGGSTLYEVAFPAGVRIKQATVNRAWATRTGELDVPYVIGYALRIR